MSHQQLSLNLTEQLLAVYHKANSLFKPGDILITHRAIAQKIDNAWTKAILIVNKRAKVNKSTKDFIDKMDKLFNILYSKCEIVACLEKGCKDDCLQGAHSICSCPRLNKIPPLELPFIKDQREKVGRGKLSIAGVDQGETNRLQGLIDRKEKEEAGNIKIREATNSKHTRVVILMTVLLKTRMIMTKILTSTLERNLVKIV